MVKWTVSRCPFEVLWRSLAIPPLYGISSTLLAYMIGDSAKTVALAIDADEQIGFVLQQSEAGTPIGELCRETGTSEQTFYRWKKTSAGMGVAEIRRLKQLEDEDRRLKMLVADLTLDKTMLQHFGRQKW